MVGPHLFDALANPLDHEAHDAGLQVCEGPFGHERLERATQQPVHDGEAELRADVHHGREFRAPRRLVQVGGARFVQPLDDLLERALFQRVQSDPNVGSELGGQPRG